MQSLGSTLPLTAAPMSGGATTTRLARAAAVAGALPFLAGGYKTADALSAEINELRGDVESFGVNLFVPGDLSISEDDFRRYARSLQSEGEPYGLRLANAPLIEDDDNWRDKVDLLVNDPVAVVSFTFGIPEHSALAALRRAGSQLLVTVTTADEARAAAEAGVDGLVVQGPNAGGHNGTHNPRRAIVPIATTDLVREIVAATGLPVVAAGGVDGPEAVSELLAAGAASVAVGTLLLRTDESGASQTHKDALADPAFTETVITRAFTGRPARGLNNAFIRAHESEAPLGYLAVHYLTRELRRAAAAAGDPDRVHLWAGTGYRNATTGPVAAVIEELASRL